MSRRFFEPHKKPQTAEKGTFLNFEKLCLEKALRITVATYDVFQAKPKNWPSNRSGLGIGEVVL